MRAYRRKFLAAGAVAAFAASLAGCGGVGQIDRRGHVWGDTDLARLQPGMSKQEVQTSFGTPQTTSTVGGDAFYYISSTERTISFMKPSVVDRKVVAVYFDRRENVANVTQYTLQDGKVVKFAKGETAAYGKDESVVRQLLGNIGQRKLFDGQRGTPGDVSTGL
jgi:outer membrane protein assembly factor BamE (lipoprotein component of BamABCDE complex)